MPFFLKRIKSFEPYDLVVVLLGIAIVIGNTGIWPMPNWREQFVVSQNPLHVPFQDPNLHYIFFNYLQPLVFGLLGGERAFTFLVYIFSTTLLFLTLFLLWFIRHHGREVAIHEHKVWVALIFPAFMIPFYWVGMDGMTLLLMLFVLMFLGKRAAFIFAFLLGLQHFEQGIVGFGMLLGTSVIQGSIRRDKKTIASIIQIASIALAIILGKLCLSLWFSINDVGLLGNRTSYFEIHQELFFNIWKSYFPWILWSFLGVGWIVFWAYIKKLWLLTFPLLGAFLLALFVGDQTRVAVIVLFPCLFYFLLSDRELWKQMDKKLVFCLLVLYFISPVVVVWGKPHIGNLWKYDMVVMKQMNMKRTGKRIIGLSTFDYLMPFQQTKESTTVKEVLSSYRCSIKRAEESPISVSAGQKFKVPVYVTNTGNNTWPGHEMENKAFWVYLSYHVVDANKNMVLHDGVRTPLPHDIAPGVTVPLNLILQAPLQKGKYIIQADMLHELVTWYGAQSQENVSSIPFEVK